MRHYRTHEEYLDKKLKDPIEAALYLNAAIEENDPKLLIAALADVARAYGISHLARKITISRVGLHKSLSKKGNPQLKTFMNLIKATGLQMTFKKAA